MRRYHLTLLSTILLGLFCLQCQDGTEPDTVGSSDPHAVVGKWEALEGRRVISFYEDGLASVHSISARWRAIDDSSVRIDFQNPLISDNEFRVSSSSDGELTGILSQRGREVKDSSGRPRIYRKALAAQRRAQADG